MAVQCIACSKVNPSDAVYCYYDGRALATGSNEGPMRVGAMPFPMPFCFSDGENCKNFNQLALACDARWDESRRLLTDGIWQTFFTAMGRLDLATTAQQAARQPDLDVGLSQLLEKFPTDPDVLRPPKLALSATQQDLGTLAPGTDRSFPLQIANQGLLVLRGMVTSDCEWLSIGQPAGQPAMRVFQTRANHTLTVKVLGHKLRAGRKPLEGTIVVDTNGGNTTVVVRAQVPVRPFPKVNGNKVLAGATSPHELAVKAKAHPLEAASLFEQGAVRAWYASNGWTYPIQGTEGTGKGAVQQFFEALGLTKAPRLEISAQQITCKGKPGQRLTKQITISTQENRPVYANAWANQDWIRPGVGKPQGNKVTIPLQINVPEHPGETLNASVTLQGNGNQQFVVPVTLSVAAAAAREEEEEEAAEKGGGLRIGWLVAAIVVMIVITAGVVGFIIKGHEQANGPVVENPNPNPNPPGKPPVQPPVGPPDKTGTAWWDKTPGAGLTASLAALREIVPQEKDLLDGIADSSDLKRYNAYDSLKDKLPVLLRNVKVREPLGRMLADCCVFEPEDRNVSPLSQALTSQLPRDRAEFSPAENGDELRRALWSFNTLFSALMHKAVHRERVGMLARQLGSVLGLDLNTAAPPDELKKQATELLARLCYRGTLPTAAKSVEHALLMRDDLLKEFPGQIPLGERAKIDVDVVARGLAKSGAAFPRLEPILKDCLENGDLTTSFKILDLYERAKPDLAPKLEGVLSAKWKVLANPKLLTQADKAIALRKFLSKVAPKIAPAERLALMQKLAAGALTSAKATPKKDLVYLQDTLKLAHASAMAAALFHKDTGLERFDELAARAPEIEQPEPEKTEEKKTDKPEKTKPTSVKGGVTIGVQPKVYNGQLTQLSAHDTRRNGLCDVYSFNLQAGQLYTIDHMSRSFDAYLRLEDPRGFTIAEDDDSGGSLNSRITFQASMNGVHRVIATSLGGRGTGPYTLMIRRGAGGFGPGFGRPIRRIPGLGFPSPVPGLPLPDAPGQMPGEMEPKDKEKNSSQFSVSDLVTLEKNKQRSARVAALENIAANASNDIAARHARRLARYLLSVQGNELDEIAPKLESFNKCRPLILALADQVDKTEGAQKTTEKVVGDIVGQNLQFDRDEDWRTASRRILLQRALELGAPAATNVAEQAAEILREIYKEQGYAFGMEESELASCTRPAQVLGAVIKYVAGKADKDGAAPEHKEALERAGRYVQAAEFVAESDLEQLIVMQRIWLKVLSIYLQKSTPAYAKPMSDLQQELVTRDRRATGLLDQLRAGEERALRIWALANNLKS